MPLSNKIFDKIVLIITSQTLEIHLKKRKIGSKANWYLRLHRCLSRA